MFLINKFIKTDAETPLRSFLFVSFYLKCLVSAQESERFHLQTLILSWSSNLEKDFTECQSI